MKQVLPVLGVIALFACGSAREIEVDLVNAELVRIDTVYRYPNVQQKVLTWRASETNVQYISYASLGTAYSLGARMLIMVKK